MRIFKFRLFNQWAKKQKMSDTALMAAVNEIKSGLFDAYLGNGLYKQRIARKNQGKSRGYRTILAYKNNDRTIFMYGFAKNDKTNINAKEEMVYKKLASYYLEIHINQIEVLVKNGELIEVVNDEN